ncbi:MAG: hypothetical protein ABFD91_15685 [Anaerohalosphaeraceae bacterium]
MSMKQLVTIFTLTLMAGAVYAAPTKIKAIADGAPLSPAYEFMVTNGTLGIYSAPQSFRTFCLEAGETFTNGVTYFAVINTAAVKGGTGSSDPLDPRTAYLYTQYMAGAYGYGFDTENALQEVIHYIEGERSALSTDEVWSEKAETYLKYANKSGWTTIGNVRVVNLWTNYDEKTNTFSGFAQDQLVLVPAPGALLLASIGMAIVGGLRRRQSV